MRMSAINAPLLEKDANRVFNAPLLEKGANRVFNAPLLEKGAKSTAVVCMNRTMRAAVYHGQHAGGRPSHYSR